VTIAPRRMAGKGVQNGIVILTGRRADSPWCSTKTLRRWCAHCHTAGCAAAASKLPIAPSVMLRRVRPACLTIAGLARCQQARPSEWRSESPALCTGEECIVVSVKGTDGEPKTEEKLKLWLKKKCWAGSQAAKGWHSTVEHLFQASGGFCCRQPPGPMRAMCARMLSGTLQGNRV